MIMFNIFVFVLHAGEWPKKQMTNRDIIRMQIACDSMDIDARASIYYAALNAFGKKGVNTNM